MNPLDRALALAHTGLPVMPCLETKAPACPGGFKTATTDRAAIAELWRLHPAPLVGVPTGEASGLDVLDIDPCHNGDRWLAANRSRLPVTREHRTRSGGWHLIFRHRPGLRNSAGRIADGVDVRAGGGYLIWWPAVGLAVQNPDTVLQWPAWLMDVLAPHPVARPIRAPLVQGSGYAAAALRRAVEAVGRAAAGTRNETLNREAFGLSRFAVSGALAPQNIADVLATAGLAAGLTEREVAGTLASAFRAAGVML